MIKHIKRIQSKPAHIREQYLWGYLIIIMVIIGAIWILSLNFRFKSHTALETEQAIKPFQLFGNAVKNVYQDTTASVGNINTKTETPKNEDKIIPLIPVNN